MLLRILERVLVFLAIALLIGLYRMVRGVAKQQKTQGQTMKLVRKEIAEAMQKLEKEKRNS